MPLKNRAVKKFSTGWPVSYASDEPDVFRDARNVYTNRKRLDTRHGISRYNATAFSAAPKSVTFFKENDNTTHIVVKDGGTLYDAQATGAHTSIKTGLSSGTKHRAVSFNNRHIIAIEGDGLFSWDGTTFSQLGQAPPSTGSVALDTGTGLTDGDTYQVQLTFYSSSLGFESNAFASAEITTTTGNQTIDVTNIPATAANTFIDKVRVYLKNVTDAGTANFVSEINLGTTTATITEEPSSTQTPPTTNAAPQTGGGKYLVVFGDKIAYAGNSSFQSDVYFSGSYLPDAWDDSDTDKTINIGGQGSITGLAVGLYNNDNLSPYLVAFKRNSFDVYSELGGSASQVPYPNGIGCVSHDTIQVIGGDVYFMSTQGWHVISNGRLRRVKDSNFIDGGLINDIFTQSGFVYEINQGNTDNFFSVFYPTLNQYITFISEGSSNSVNKAYNFEFDIGGFRPYDFQVTFNGGVLGEASGKDVVYLVGENGYIYQHSTSETVGTDVDKDGNSVAIDAFALFFWINGDDMDATYNYGPFIMRALAQDNAITVKYFLDYSLQSPTDMSYTFNDPETGFILDISKLDEGVLGDGRTIVRYVGEINKTSQSLLVGLYKQQAGENMAVLDVQLDLSKNGNSN